MHYRLSTNVAHLWINDTAKNAIIFADNSTFSLGFPSFLQNNEVFLAIQGHLGIPIRGDTHGSPGIQGAQVTVVR